jgi:uncharacterized protein (DUF608 family)
MTNKNKDLPVGHSRRGRKAMSADEERITTIVNSQLYGKCRAIADLENIHLKDIINKALENVIKAYEDKNGPIKAKVIRQKGDINDIF